MISEDSADLIMLLWYTFYAQFELLTAVLRSFLYDTSFTIDYTWYFKSDTYEIRYSWFILSGLIWDSLIVYVILNIKTRINRLTNIIDDFK